MKTLLLACAASLALATAASAADVVGDRTTSSLAQSRGCPAHFNLLTLLKEQGGVLYCKNGWVSQAVIQLDAERPGSFRVVGWAWQRKALRGLMFANYSTNPESQPAVLDVTTTPAPEESNQAPSESSAKAIDRGDDTSSPKVVVYERPSNTVVLPIPVPLFGWHHGYRGPVVRCNHFTCIRR